MVMSARPLRPKMTGRSSTKISMVASAKASLISFTLAIILGRFNSAKQMSVTKGSLITAQRHCTPCGSTGAKQSCRHFVRRSRKNQPGHPAFSSSPPLLVLHTVRSSRSREQGDSGQSFLSAFANTGLAQDFLLPTLLTVGRKGHDHN